MQALIVDVKDGKEDIYIRVQCSVITRTRVASVMTASVPSDPTSRRVKSYPAALLRARDPVRTTVPSCSTAVRLSTFSRIVP